MPGANSFIPVADEMVRFYQDLVEVCEKQEAGCRIDIIRTDAAGELGEDAGQRPLIMTNRPVFDAASLYESFRGVLAVLSVHRPEFGQDIDIIAGLPKPVIAKVLDEFIAGGENIVGAEFHNLGVNRKLLRFVVFHAVKPFLSAYARAVAGRIDTAGWREGFCPVCGKWPHLGRLAGDNGKKYLRCSMCGTEWPAKMIACHYCGNEDHRTMVFLLVEETPGYRIDACEKCKGYLKVMDEKAEPQRDVSLDDVHTVFLDLIAAQNGYVNR